MPKPIENSHSVRNVTGLIHLCVLLLLGFSLMPLHAADQIIKAEIGRLLFFDTQFSKFRNQSCASCHDPSRGFVDTRDNDTGAAVSLGSDEHSLGDRNTPSLTYTAITPAFTYDEKTQQYKGGMFWDGRARNLVDQAGMPILDPTEMALPDKRAVLERLRNSAYYRDRLSLAFGEQVLDSEDRAFAAVTESIAAFESTAEFSPFNSRYDRYLRGEYELSDLEDLGMSIFFSTTNSNCSSCHQLKVMDDEGETFTNYEYHNIGTPINDLARSRNGRQSTYRDPGLGQIDQDIDSPHNGKFKVPGLRNVAITGPYMHNGVFRDLRTVIEFYDQYNNPARTDNPETGQPWKQPETPETVNREDLKAKKLTDRKIDALIAFLQALTDQRYEHLLDQPTR